MLLKSRTLFPALDAEAEAEEEAISPEELAERLEKYLKIRRAAGALRERMAANAGLPLGPGSATQTRTSSYRSAPD